MNYKDFRIELVECIKYLKLAFMELNLIDDEMNFEEVREMKETILSLVKDLEKYE